MAPQVVRGYARRAYRGSAATVARRQDRAGRDHSRAAANFAEEVGTPTCPSTENRTNSYRDHRWRGQTGGGVGRRPSLGDAPCRWPCIPLEGARDRRKRSRYRSGARITRGVVARARREAVEPRLETRSRARRGLGAPTSDEG